MVTAETPIPTTETAQPSTPASTVTDAEWKAMQTVLNNIYAYRTDDGEDPSKLFQRKVNKRSLPDYYEVIKEPMALSTIKAKIAAKEYKNFAEYVRDFALIPHNAQVYNRPESGAYIDALIVKDVLVQELQKLVEEKIISEDSAKLPYLGEIPSADDLPPLEPEEEEEEEDDEDDEEDDEEDSEDEGRRKRKKGARSAAAISKRESGVKAEKGKDEEDPEARKKRGRPPRVDTPLEARIKNIMKGIRRSKNPQNQLKISQFDRLPDKAAMPEYFAEIKQPIAVDNIKKKLKRKKYTSLDQFMRDIELMFENAKLYNTDDSQIYKDAVDLQKEARALAEEEKKKPDSDYAMEDGRIPLPDGILHNGELWKVGDWVHIQNANDLTKPIVAQIYRTWQDQDGNKWVNACWYYRPEQTVHRFDRHFYENEVVKTGQYRDHPIDEIIDRCFVMFFTRYNKGRPRNFPADKEIYVCESRYNEEKHKLNKIKTWASCLPDEVRDKDYEMDLFDAPKKMKKVPSPIKYLFKEDEQKETDDLPKPVWGAPNAPPKIGAVHCRPRDPKESPPPEPTPTPPPAPPPPPAREVSSASQHAHVPSYTKMRPPAIDMPTPGLPHVHAQALASGTPSHSQPAPAFTPSNSAQFHQNSASPAPLQALQPSHLALSSAPHQPSFHPPPLTPQSSYSGRTMTATAPAPQYSTPQHYSGPTITASYQPRPAQSQTPAALGYQQPPPVECYRLPDIADDMIPPDVRQQFQTDANGRVLFFTAPPLNSAPPKSVERLQHSAKYLAWRAKRDEELAALKRKRDSESGRSDAEEQKRRRLEQQEAKREQHRAHVEAVAAAMIAIEDSLADALVADYRREFGGRWKEELQRGLDELGEMQVDAAKENEELLRAKQELAKIQRDVAA